MKNITKKLFLFAFILALVATGAIYSYLKSFETQTQVEVEKISILVAAKDIPARTKITEDMLQTIEIPKEGDFGSFINDKAALIDHYTKEPIYQNERFVGDKLLEGIEEELSLMIKPDHRALSVMVNLDSGVSDLLRPGDFVDVLIFLPELREADRILRPDVAKMILQSIEVLAVNQQLYRDAEPPVEIPSAFCVTLEVHIYVF